MNIVRTHRSPNYNARPHGVVVNGILLHADGDSSVANSIGYICTPGLAKPPVSYHCIVGREGDIYELVDPDDRAWHAGVSAFQNVADCNNYMVGVCLGNKQDGREPFTQEALKSTAEYCAYLMLRKYPAITLDRITTHAIVALPEGRKSDPCPAGPFDLDAFKALVNECKQDM